MSISSEAGVIYDPDLDENLPRTFADLGLETDTFVTIIDEEDDSPKVNLVLAVSAR